MSKHVHEVLHSQLRTTAQTSTQSFSKLLRPQKCFQFNTHLPPAGLMADLGQRERHVLCGPGAVFEPVQGCRKEADFGSVPGRTLQQLQMF